MSADQLTTQAAPQVAPETWYGKSGMGVTWTLGVYRNLEALYGDNVRFLDGLETHIDAIDSLILAQWLEGQLSAPRSANDHE